MLVLRAPKARIQALATSWKNSFILYFINIYNHCHSQCVSTKPASMPIAWKPVFWSYCPMMAVTSRCIENAPKPPLRLLIASQHCSNTFRSARGVLPLLNCSIFPFIQLIYFYLKQGVKLHSIFQRGRNSLNVHHYKNIHQSALRTHLYSFVALHTISFDIKLCQKIATFDLENVNETWNQTLKRVFEWILKGLIFYFVNYV